VKVSIKHISTIKIFQHMKTSLWFVQNSSNIRHKYNTSNDT